MQYFLEKLRVGRNKMNASFGLVHMLFILVVLMDTCIKPYGEATTMSTKVLRDDFTRVNASVANFSEDRNLTQRETSSDSLDHHIETSLIDHWTKDCGRCWFYNRTYLAIETVILCANDRNRDRTAWSTDGLFRLVPLYLTLRTIPSETGPIPFCKEIFDIHVITHFPSLNELTTTTTLETNISDALELATERPMGCEQDMPIRLKLIEVPNGKNVTINIDIAAFPRLPSISLKKRGSTEMIRCYQPHISEKCYPHHERYIGNLFNDTFQLSILNSAQEDSGIYDVQMQESNRQELCSILSVNISIVLLEPTCFTFFLKEDSGERLLCTWLSQDNVDKVQVMITTQTMNSTNKTNEYFNSSISIDGTASVGDIFLSKAMLNLNTCDVSHLRTVRRTCSSTFLMEPTVMKLGKSESNCMPFMCYTTSTSFPDIWLLDKHNNSLKFNIIKQSKIFDDFEITLLCGEEDNGRIVIYNRGKLNLSFNNYTELLVSAEKVVTLQSSPCSTYIYKIAITQSVLLPTYRYVYESETTRKTTPHYRINSSVSTLPTISKTVDHKSVLSIRDTHIMLISVVVMSALALLISLRTCLYSRNNFGYFPHRGHVTNSDLNNPLIQRRNDEEVTGLCTVPSQSRQAPNPEATICLIEHISQVMINEIENDVSGRPLDEDVISSPRPGPSVPPKDNINLVETEGAALQTKDTTWKAAHGVEYSLDPIYYYLEDSQAKCCGNKNDNGDGSSSFQVEMTEAHHLSQCCEVDSHLSQDKDLLPNSMHTEGHCVLYAKDPTLLKSHYIRMNDLKCFPLKSNVFDDNRNITSLDYCSNDLPEGHCARYTCKRDGGESGVSISRRHHIKCNCLADALDTEMVLKTYPIYSRSGEICDPVASPTFSIGDFIYEIQECASNYDNLRRPQVERLFSNEVST